MAPEQISGRGKPIDARADQFALASITYEMLTGQDAFFGEDAVSLLYQIVHEEPQPLERHVQWDSRRVQQVLSRAMAKDPALRFPTIVDFADALREAADHAHAPATPPPILVAAAPRPAAPLDVPVSGQPWTEREITQSIPRVPRLAYRPIVLTLALASAIGFVAAKGWIRPLPGSVVIAAHSLKARLLGALAPAPAAPAPAPMTGASEAARTAPVALPLPLPPPPPATAAAPSPAPISSPPSPRPQRATKNRRPRQNQNRNRRVVFRSIAPNLRQMTEPEPRIPLATYRFQFNRHFTLRDATALVPYLDALGISDIYASPFLAARPGSLHGYDVVDPTRLNPEIGTDEDLDELSVALRARGMGLLMDVVPNHMCIASADNRYWQDVLENGRSSPSARLFDIDWYPAQDRARRQGPAAEPGRSVRPRARGAADRDRARWRRLSLPLLRHAAARWGRAPSARFSSRSSPICGAAGPTTRRI